MPQSLAPRPDSSRELRRIVHRYLAQRAVATVAPERIAVIGAEYFPVGVSAIVASRVAAEAGVVRARAQAALEAFLHPVAGGPEGRGFAFGRGVYLSDIAAVLEALDGVDYVSRVDLLVDGIPAGESVAVPGDRIVAAGPVSVETTGRRAV